MNEEAMKAAFEDDDIEQEELEKEELEKEQAGSEDPPKLSALEEEAQGMGHTSKDEWEAAGKDPDKWKTPHEYVSFGHIKQQMDKNKESFEKRLDEVNKFHKAQMDAKVKALEATKKAAVREADEEGYDAAQKEIDELKEVAPNPTGKDPAIAEWEAANPWIDDRTKTINVNGIDIPKADITQSIFASFQHNNPNATPKQALAHIDAELAKLDEPPANPRRNQPTANERSTVTHKKSGKLTWSDLTAEERQDWNQFGFDLYDNNKADFLKVAKDLRAK